jgi:hypothetical protein
MRSNFMLLDSDPQPIERQIACHPIRHGPTHNTPAVQIQRGGQVEPPFLGGDVGDIRHPLLIGSLGREVPLQHVRRYGRY